LGNTRRALGISCRELGRRTALGPQRIARAERGEVDALTIDVAARIAPALGLQLAVSLHPNGDPVRDKGHLALIDRLRRRLPRLALHVEVPIPIVGDLRSADALITLPVGDILVEAETHLGDIQLIERRAAAKARDLSALHTILLVADTRHNVQVINEHPELRERFPVDGRTCLARLVNGVDPGGDALVIL
jgi:transcriptional regulator with XRE-family HTH domain